MIKAVIFDYNGTLANDTEKMAKLFSNALESVGHKEINIDEFKAKFILPPANLAKNFGLEDEKAKKAITNFVEQCNSYENKTFLFDDTKEVLRYLHNCGIRTVILTSYHEQPLIKELRENGITRYINEIITEHDKPKAIKDYLLQFGLRGSEVISVGDAEFDTSSAKESGVVTIGFCGGYRSRTDLSSAKPDYLIDCLGEIIPILEKQRQDTDITSFL